MQDSIQWIYGALTILFVGLFYIIKEVIEVKTKQKTMETTLPIISSKLDELNNTLKMFLKQEIEVLKDIAQSNKERNEKENIHHE